MASDVSKLPPELQIEIEKLRIRLSEERSKLTLLQRPLATLRHFGASSWSGVWHVVQWVTFHPATRYAVLPTLLLYMIVRGTGMFQAQLADGHLWGEWFIWWFTLGVLSSIGFGSGMHSGLLFLFPHILKVCLAAERCSSLDFDVRMDTWWRPESFGCLGSEWLRSANATSTDNMQTLPLFSAVYLKVLPTAIVWGIGTAFGEIPPYLLSYQAAKAGERSIELEGAVCLQNEDDGKVSVEKKQHIENTRRANSLVTSLPQTVGAMKEWMLKFIKNRGFWGIVLLASYPNAAFDLCGICCGQFMMPFWQFLGATVLGKGFIKILGQTALVVLLFMRSTRERAFQFLERALLSALYSKEGLGLHRSSASVIHSLHHRLEVVINEFQNRLAKQADASHPAFQAAAQTLDAQRATVLSRMKISFEALIQGFKISTFRATVYRMIPSTPWGIFVFLIVGSFIKSVIEQVARAHAAELDANIIQRQVAKVSEE